MPKKVVLLDGAAGTSLWEKTGDTRPVWTYNVDRPEAVKELNREYVAAGSEIILANTFCANAPAVEKEGYNVHEVITRGMRLAKAAAEGHRVKVGLCAGPLTSLLKPFGDVTHERAAEIYREMFEAGMEEKPDLIALITFMDLEMISIALREAVRFNLPVFCSMSFTKFGKTMMGNNVEKICARLEGEGASVVGLNCSLGPDAALPILQKFIDTAKVPVMFKPNAGLPNENGDSSFDADVFAKDIVKAADMGAAYVGGCCGTNAQYIARAAKLLAER